jgi:hypothetical protein
MGADSHCCVLHLFGHFAHRMRDARRGKYPFSQLSADATLSLPAIVVPIFVVGILIIGILVIWVVLVHGILGIFVIGLVVIRLVHRIFVVGVLVVRIFAVAAGGASNQHANPPFCRERNFVVGRFGSRGNFEFK